MIYEIRTRICTQNARFRMVSGIFFYLPIVYKKARQYAGLTLYPGATPGLSQQCVCKDS